MASTSSSPAEPAKHPQHIENTLLPSFPTTNHRSARRRLPAGTSSSSATSAAEIAEYKSVHCSVFHASMPGICGYCGRGDAKSFCSACRLAVYCNKKCQRTHWKQHKPACRRLSDVRAVATAPLLQVSPGFRQQVDDPVTLISLQIFKHFDKRANDYLVYESAVKHLLDRPIDMFGWARLRIRRLLINNIQYLIDHSIGIRVTIRDRQFRSYVTVSSSASEDVANPIDLGQYDMIMMDNDVNGQGRHANKKKKPKLGDGTDEFTFRHPTTLPEQDENVPHMGMCKPMVYSPITTKASLHVKTINFVHTHGYGRVIASYKNQLSVRVDNQRKCLNYDCYEFKPSPTSGRLRSEDEAHLPDVESINRYHETITCNLPAGVQYIGNPQTVRTICHMKALSGDFFNSRCFRFRVPLDHVCGIRLIQESKDDEGDPSLDVLPNEKHDPWDIPGVLILEFAKPPDMDLHPFCSRTVARNDSAFTIINDWTPGQNGSKATRHYITGAVLELQELAAHLCVVDDRIASLMATTGGTLSAQNMDFSKSPSFDERATVVSTSPKELPLPGAFDGGLDALVDCVKDRLVAMSEAGNHVGALYIAKHLGFQ